MRRYLKAITTICVLLAALRLIAVYGDWVAPKGRGVFVAEAKSDGDKSTILRCIAGQNVGIFLTLHTQSAKSAPVERIHRFDSDFGMARNRRAVLRVVAAGTSLVIWDERAGSVVWQSAAHKCSGAAISPCAMQDSLIGITEGVTSWLTLATFWQHRDGRQVQCELCLDIVWLPRGETETGTLPMEKCVGHAKALAKKIGD